MMIGERIRKQRELMNFTISELAERSGVAKSYISSIERGIQTNPSLQFLVKIAESLEIRVEELMESSERFHIDKEWKELIQEAIQMGISKEEFKSFIRFVRLSKK